MIITAMTVAALIGSRSADSAAEEVYDCAAPENRDKPMTVEIVLSKKWKEQASEVEESLRADDGSVKVRLKFFPFLDPPTNIGIGKCVPAELARRAMEATVRYNGKPDRLIRQDILPHHWIKIGSTDTAELAWTPVQPEDVERLMDPALTTEQFQELYRRLAAPKERKRPFGMGSEKIEGAPQK
jgi:hypothetical protein